MRTANKRKVKGAIVWHRNQLRQISSQEAGIKNVVLDDQIRIRKSSIKLARIGDFVDFKDASILPERCRTIKNMRITYFLDNGIVGTDKDLYEDCGGSDYSHFKASEDDNHSRN